MTSPTPMGKRPPKKVRSVAREPKHKKQKLGIGLASVAASKGSYEQNQNPELEIASFPPRTPSSDKPHVVQAVCHVEEQTNVDESLAEAITMGQVRLISLEHS
jgi:hypothetical protein